MPQNGEKNRKFGFYKNLCCGKEIVVPEGNQFPNCVNHPKLTTIWKPIVTDTAVELGKKPAAGRGEPRFHKGDQVRIVGPDPNKGQYGVVVHILEGRHDFVHRYVVDFSHGNIGRYFGFQLELLQTESEAA